MDEPLTPDEDVVYQEFTRLDVEPNQIPPIYIPVFWNGWPRHATCPSRVPVQRYKG